MAMEHISHDVITEQGIKEKKTSEAVQGSSIAEGITGTGAIVLSIIGLAGVFAGYMAVISTILVGVALLMEGFTIGARFSSLAPESATGTYSRFRGMELGGGLAAEFLGGVAGIVLGILALVGILPLTLVSVAAIVYGASLIFGIGASSQLSDIEIDKNCGVESRPLTRAAVKSAEDMRMFIGLGALVLGILAVIGLIPMTLTLVAMLSIGFADLMSGSTVSRRLLHSRCA